MTYPVAPPTALEYVLSDWREQKGDLKTWLGLARAQLLLAAGCVSLLLPNLIGIGAESCRNALANAGWWWVASIATTFLACGAAAGLQSLVGTELKQQARAASLGEPVHASKPFAGLFKLSLVLAVASVAAYSWSFGASLWYTSQSLVCVASAPSPLAP